MTPSNKLHHIESGSGPPLLLIHGLFDSLETWEAVLSPLSEHFKVYAIDLPGFGKSILPEDWKESISGMVKSVVAFLDEKSITRASLVGSSMGGGLALTISGQHPERVERIVLINPYGLPLPPVAVTVAQSPISGRLLPYLLTKPALKRCAKALFTRSVHNPDWVTDVLVERVIHPFSTLRQRKNLFRFLKGISSKEIEQIDLLLPKIRQPVLILWGENDRWLSEAHAKRLQMRLPQSKLIKIPSCGHLPQIEKPKEVIEAIISFDNPPPL